MQYYICSRLLAILPLTTKGSTVNHFETLSQLRQNPTDITKLPHRQLASKVFRMVNEIYMTNWEPPTALRPDVPPEMLEACFSRIFGKTMMTEVIGRLTALVEELKGRNIHDVYMPKLWQKTLLGKIAEKSAWGQPATEDVNKLSFLIYILLGSQLYVGRFVDQTIKRIDTVH